MFKVLLRTVDIQVELLLKRKFPFEPFPRNAYRIAVLSGSHEWHVREDSTTELLYQSLGKHFKFRNKHFDILYRVDILKNHKD